MKRQTSNTTRQTSMRGFSLIEIMISVLLVGLSITAMVVATNSFTMANGAGADLSTAEFLVEQIRELTAMMAVDSLSALNDVTYAPPIGSNQAVLNDLAGFSQHIVVECVRQSDFSMGTTSSDFIRISVTVSLNGRPITSASWLRTRY
jgi:prepilin-type N-terminal cleavage/methylation domain-containing protein